MLVGGGGTNKVNGTPTKKVSFVTNGDEDDDGNDDFDIDFEDDDNELSVDGGGIGGHEVTPEVSERAERLERAKQNPNVSVLRDFLRIGRLVVKFKSPPGIVFSILLNLFEPVHVPFRRLS